MTADVAGRSIVFVLYYYEPYTSGLTAYTRLLAEDLARRGAHVQVVTSQHEAELPLRETINDVEVRRHPVKARFGKGVVAPGLLMDAVRLGRRADVVAPVAPLAEIGAIAALVPRRTLLPIYVCDLRLQGGPLGWAIEQVAAASARLAVRRAHRHVVLSLDYARASRVVSRFTARAIGVAPPVEAERYRYRDPGPLRARLGIDDRPVVGFAGRLVFEKGVPVLIEAMRAVRRSHPDAILAIAGEGRAVAGGGMADEIHDEVRNDHDVIVTGFLSHDDLLAFYSMCTVLALPSIDPLEAFGMVQVESMLCGSPVVASALPGVRLPIQSTGMGLLVRPGAAGELATALTRVLDDPDRFTRTRAEVMSALDPAISYEAMARAVMNTSLAP